jgi:hypothetical protein
MSKTTSQGLILKHYLNAKDVDFDDLWRLMGYTSQQTLDFHLQREKLSPHFIDDIEHALHINVADILSKPPLIINENVSKEIDEDENADMDEDEDYTSQEPERIITRTETVIPIFLGKNRIAKIVLPEDYSKEDIIEIRRILEVYKK